MGRITGSIVRDLAAKTGFALAGVTPVGAITDFARFRGWADRGLAGDMRYLTDHRAEIRSNPEILLPGAKSIICLGMLYGGPEPYSSDFSELERGWIARYAWGEDYHGILRLRLDELAAKLLQIQDFTWRSCVDTAPLLERSIARQAGLGWIGKNTCLINQRLGSWFFLGELLITLELEPDVPAPDRCGTCSRCIDACPTAAIVPSPDGRFELDARLCISYFTIELRGSIPVEQRAKIGNNIFGCDICQDVCPWNRQGEVSDASPGVSLERMAALSEVEFRRIFRNTAVSRAKYSGFLRNVAVAMGNSGLAKFRAPLERLAASGDALVAEHAAWGLQRLDECHF
ncbi:MAG TPA: tRNA epoxyqueuosine(34) reductase QueG [Bryobacteraceae bacterium]|nr:tRNA epoxyqueuosine(34) reductase QueG [Bryobacteraceae bacterium]